MCFDIILIVFVTDNCHHAISDNVCERCSAHYIRTFYRTMVWQIWPEISHHLSTLWLRLLQRLVFDQRYLFRYLRRGIFDARSHPVLVRRLHVHVPWAVFVHFWHHRRENKDNKDCDPWFCVLYGNVYWIRYVQVLHAKIFAFTFENDNIVVLFIFRCFGRNFGRIWLRSYLRFR